MSALSRDTRRPPVSEVKFLLDVSVARRVQDWARRHLSPDPNGDGPFGDAYHTSSLYFDTAAFDIFSRRGSFAYSKYRIRRYGEDGVLFLERKLKRRGALRKRRSKVDIATLGWLNAAEPMRTWDGYWFQRRALARQLRPVCEISYHRTARAMLATDDLIRLTIDEMVEARPVNTAQFSVVPGLPLLPQQCILELKYRVTLPPLFKRLVEDFALTPRPLSKYRLAVQALRLVDVDPAATELEGPDASYA